MSGLIDGLIPATSINGKIGLYKQVGDRYRDSALYDVATWDDGYKIDLRFVKSITEERTMETLPQEIEMTLDEILDEQEE